MLVVVAGTFVELTTAEEALLLTTIPSFLAGVLVVVVVSHLSLFLANAVVDEVEEEEEEDNDGVPEVDVDDVVFAALST